MIASAVLLDCNRAFRAIFGVCNYPIVGLRVVGASLEPLFQVIAMNRFVPVSGARKAETGAAWASDEMSAGGGNLDSSSTINSWTPLQIDICIDITIDCQPSIRGFNCGVFDVEHHFLVVNQQLALRRHTLNFALPSYNDLLCQICFPAF